MLAGRGVEPAAEQGAQRLSLLIFVLFCFAVVCLRKFVVVVAVVVVRSAHPDLEPNKEAIKSG